MNVTIVGSRGRIGSTLLKIISGNGHHIAGAYDRGDIIDRETVADSDATLLAVPLRESIHLIEDLSGTGSIIEVSSVKAPIERFRNRVISIHPLFGPSSVDSADFRTILHVNDISPEGSAELIRALFPDRTVVSLTAAEHDRAMADLLVMPYIMSRLSAFSTGEGHGLETPSHSLVRRISGILDGENSEVVKDTLSRNRYTAGIIDGIEKRLEEIRGELN